MSICRLLSGTLACVIFLTITDAKAQWQPVYPAVMPFMEAGALTELSAGRLIAGMPSGIFRSDDFGLTWDRVPNTPPRCIQIASDGTRTWGLFYSIFSYTHSLLSYSDDFGSTWDTVALDPGNVILQPLGGYMFETKGGLVTRYDVSTVPATIDTVLKTTCVNLRLSLTGQRLWLSTSCGLFRSSDFGTTWDTIHPSWSQFPDGGFCVSGDSIIWATTDGIKRSINGGDTWESISFPNVESTFWREGTLYRLNSGLYRSDDAGLTWSTLWTPSDVTQSINSLFKRGDVLVGFSDEGLWRSITGGANWYLSNGTFKTSTLYDFGNAGPFLWADDFIVMNFSGDGGRSWFAPIVAGTILHVKIPGYLNGSLFGITYDNKLFRSTGSIKIWEQIPSSNLPTGGKQMMGLGNALFLACTTDSTRIYRSLDQGVSWVQVKALWDDGFKFANMTAGGNVLYVYHKALGILKSADLGDSWVAANGNLTPAQQMGYDNLVATSNFLYLRNAASVFASPDSGGQWLPLSLELNGEYLGDIAAQDSTIFAYYGEGGMKKSVGFSGIWEPMGYAHFGFPVDNQMVVMIPNALVVFLRNSNKVAKYELDNLGFQTFSGLVFDDVNANDIQDPGEPGYANALLWLSQSGHFATTDDHGNFSVLANGDGDTLRIIPPLPYSISNPSYHLISANDTASKDFAISRLPGITDISVSLTNVNVFRPGFESQIVFTLQNLGTVAAKGNILQLELPVMLQFLHAEVPPASIQGNIITWTFDSLAVLSTRMVTISVKTSSSTAIGEVLELNLTGSTLLADNQPSNNQAVLQATVVGSYDPNDKQVEPTPYTNTHLANGIPLKYTIRFQNTGNYLAERVRIVDTLSELLDPLSIQVLNYSHPFTRKIHGTHILEFLFDNINLPDSAQNEVSSHGFVQFSIKPKKEFIIGEEIANTAQIYFDFNPAVVTNTVVTSITVVATFEPSQRALPLEVFPNPASNFVTLRLPESVAPAAGRIEIFSAEGKLVYSAVTQGNLQELELAGVTLGPYWCRWIAEGKIFWGKVVIQR